MALYIHNIHIQTLEHRTEASVVLLAEDLPDQELNAEPQQVIGANLLVVLYFSEHPEVFKWQSWSSNC